MKGVSIIPFFSKAKSTLRAIIPRGVRMMVFDLNLFKPDTLFSTAKNRVSRKMPPLLKFLTAKKWLILGVKLESLEAPLRLVEQLDKEVELGCRSSRMCN
jgi:hypothetical protein